MDSTGGSVIGSAHGCVRVRSERGGPGAGAGPGVWGTNPHGEQSWAG